MGRPPSESSRSQEADISEGKPPTDKPGGNDDVLRHKRDYIPLKPPTKQEIANAYSPEWAQFKATKNVLNHSGKDDNEAVHRWIRDVNKSDPQFNPSHDARKRFSQTSEGKTVQDMQSAMQNARKRLAETDQMKKLKAATTTKENAVEQALYATSEWKQLEELESIVFKAKKAWVDLQKQAQLYTKEYARPPFEQQLHRALDHSASSRDIPKPDATAFYQAKQTWEQNKQEFEEYQNQNSQNETS